MKWDNLYFTLTKDDGSILVLGDNGITNKFPIKKNNELFDNLLTFDEELKEREIELEVYFNDIIDVQDFQNFFELSKYSQSYKYDMSICANNRIYNAQCYTNEKAFDITEVEDLFFTKTKKSATVKLKLIVENQYLYSNTSYKKEIGSSFDYLIRYPFYVGMNNKTNYIKFGTQQQLQPHVIDNVGNEDNGIILTISASEDIKTPIVINQTTSFEMGFNVFLSTGDVMVINTIKKTVTLNGESVSNVKRLFDKWLTLQNGVNVVEFTAEVGQDNASVLLEYMDKFRTVQA